MHLRDELNLWFTFCISRHSAVLPTGLINFTLTCISRVGTYVLNIFSNIAILYGQSMMFETYWEVSLHGVGCQ
jgi:hypothetical protein